MHSPIHRTHGLSGELGAPDWPPLEAAELRALLLDYPELGAFEELLWRSPRPLSAAGLLRCSSGRVFVKRHHHRVRSTTALEEEHRFIAHLRQRHLPVPRILDTRAARSWSQRGDWIYELQETAPGIDLYRDTMSWQPPRERSHARAAGNMLARLQEATADYRAAQRSTHILVARSEILRAAEPLERLRSQLRERPTLARYLGERDWERELAEALTPWHALAQPRLAALAPTWTHGDWHVSNLCWSRADAAAEVSAVLDFGLAARNFELFDLATAIERNAVAWLDLENAPARPAIALALIDGYRERRALTTADLDLLAALLPLVHIDFALSEVEYFAGVVGSRASADIAWNVFLRGHAAWFREPPGLALLETIRRARH